MASNRHRYTCLTSIVSLVMLSRVCTAAAIKNGTTATAKVALALQGGGFRAHCTDTGLIAGLLKFVSQENDSASPTLESTGLLSRFDTFSSNSGSTWFFSELVYSRRFQTLVESMASSPQTAADLFNKQWFDPMKQALRVDPSIFNPKRSIAEWLVIKIFGQGDEDTIFAMQFILSTNSTWSEFVQIILSSTASIDKSITLSSPVGKWVDTKYWLVDHTILLPSRQHRGFLFTKNISFDTYDYYQTATYFVKGDKGSSKVPIFIPAKFSMKLGEGPNCSAPFPYVASTAVPEIKGFHYTGVVFPLLDEVKAHSGRIDTIDLADGAIVENTGSLPLWGVATASSAFGGVASALGIFPNEVLSFFNHADLTPWVSKAPGGLSFERASQLVEDMKKPLGVSRRSIKAVASGAVHGVIDGGFSDGTGLGNAVASGAEEVLLVLNSADPEVSPLFLEVLCKDGPKPANLLQPPVLYPLFNTSASEVQEAWSLFEHLKLPNETQFLKRFLLGTINMTTADNRYFGIKGGRHFILHIVHIISDLQIGFFERYLNFGVLAQEIGLTILAEENKPLVKEKLLPMFMGHGMKDKLEMPIVV